MLFRSPTDLHDNRFSVTRVDTQAEALITLESSVATEYSLTGRRPLVYNAQLTPILRSAQKSKDRVIVKLAYQLASRGTGHDLVDHAMHSGVGHLPTIVAQADLWKLEDHAREVEIRKERVTRAKKTIALRELGALRDTQGFALFEDRVLRAVVYPEYGSLAGLFRTYPELIPVMVDQMIDCESLLPGRTSRLITRYTTLVRFT